VRKRIPKAVRDSIIESSEQKEPDMQLIVKGKPIGPGTEMSIIGERGRFTFKYPSWNKEGRMSLTFVGGLPGHESYRSFYVERVKKVY
jgi:hypothetical protein